MDLCNSWRYSSWIRLRNTLSLALDLKIKNVTGGAYKGKAFYSFIAPHVTINLVR